MYNKITNDLQKSVILNMLFQFEEYIREFSELPFFWHTVQRAQSFRTGSLTCKFIIIFLAF